MDPIDEQDGVQPHHSGYKKEYQLDIYSQNTPLQLCSRAGVSYVNNQFSQSALTVL
jgi:hypothetical protein